MRRRLTRCSLLALALGLTLALGLQGCVTDDNESESMVGGMRIPAGPSANHASHMALNITCADCHDVNGTGDPKIPAPETCFDCHDEDLSANPATFREYFAANRRADGTVQFPKLAYSPDLKMNHRAHTAYGTACAECHGEHSEGRFGRPELFPLKTACMQCHTEKGASNECAVCHREIRKDVAPPSHAGTFAFAHGREAPKDWQKGEGELCAMCHSVPQSCNDCHKENKPSSHRSAAFRFNHGLTEDAQEEPFENSSCALCHEKESCNRCHQTEMPRSHTTTFRRRLHGIAADVERQSCRTCHKQEYCDRCHRETKPVSHRGSFGTGRQTHCVACHDPLPSNGCYTCHKHTLGHLQATPLPLGLPHSAATDCRTCHPILPHLDDGGSCRRCHR